MYRITTLAVFVFAAVLLTACSDTAANGAGRLERIQEEGLLRVATRNAPTTYYLNRHKQAVGPETALTRAFARHLGVDIEYVVRPSIRGVLRALENGEADLAAAGLSITPGRRERFRFTEAYQQVQQQVVCNAESARPQSVAELGDVSLTVIADSSYVERLQMLQSEYPELRWKEDGRRGTEQLLHRVWEEKLDCTVADSNIVDINRRYYPELEVMFDLHEPEPLAWALPPHAEALQQTANRWLQSEPGQQARRAMQNRYYAYLPAFDFVDRRALVRRIDTVLPRYDSLFERAGENHSLPPLLLAAQAYQESKWDPKAKSPTGVRGLMMLTGRTANAMGVDNRLDPAESIHGGAKYLSRMRSRIDEAVPSPDRLLMALAAYNIGLAHLRDAQRLANRLDKNPHAWRDVKKVLPLLADKRYYPSLEYGYARGHEPVRYIHRIRDYEDVIRRHVD